jgi:hypothetical protein
VASFDTSSFDAWNLQNVNRENPFQW